jgi:hypothetical protein
MFSNIHCLHFYPQGLFSHRIDIAIRMYDQTWTFLGVHCMMAEFSRVWKRAISSRVSEVGSGLRRPAEKDAFAMASWCEAMFEIWSRDSSLKRGMLPGRH